MKKQYVTFFNQTVVKNRLNIYFSQFDFEDNTPTSYIITAGDTVNFDSVEDARDLLEDLSIEPLKAEIKESEQGATIDLGDLLQAFNSLDLANVKPTHNKEYYRETARVHGFTYGGFDHAEALHIFTKQVRNCGYLTVYLNNSDTNDKDNFNNCLYNKISRTIAA